MATATAWIGNGIPRPPKAVSELVRERETFKYEPFLVADFDVNRSGQPLPSSQLSSSTDSALTAFALLGLYQTGAERSLISLFDSNYQYIIAEAVPAIPLAPSLPSVDCPVPLAHCGTAIPRSHGTCEHVLSAVGGSNQGQFHGPAEPLPLTLVPDLTADCRFSSKPYCQFGNSGQFFAGVPIRTRMGINIGVYCVMSAKQPALWDDHSVERMRDTSRAIMKHLEANRSRHSHRRNERLNRGLGSFIEGKSTISGWQTGPNLAAFADNDTSEGALDPTQQSLEQFEQERNRDALEHELNGLAVPNDRASATRGSTPAKRVAMADTPDSLPIVQPNGNPRPHAERSVSTSGPQETHAPYIGEQSPSQICSRAANIIREAFEVEGCIFVDVTLNSNRLQAVHNANAAQKDPTLNQFVTTSSSDEHTQASPEEAPDSMCDLLGFSTTEASSINGMELTGSDGIIPKRLLRKLLQRYPQGKIFNFDAVGELLSSDSSSDDDLPVLVDDAAAASKSTNNETPSGRPRRKSVANGFRQLKEGARIRQIFPAARSVAFMPVWDTKRERWLAGSFIYTRYPTRVFTSGGELSLLKAFASLVSSDILTLETLQADKAKSDTLGSLSHELRSPLHGVILGTDLLNDTDLSVFQSNTTYTIETCCRTLLDTIDHLLDYSKVNSFAAKRRQDTSLLSPKLRKGARLAQFGKKQLFANVKLDGLVEEVAESLFAGFNFQHMSIRQLSTRVRPNHSDIMAHSRLDFARAMEQLGPRLDGNGEQILQFSNVLVYLSIDPACNWMFNVQAGAIRRIVMNLFGNSLKYTTKGTIRISLSQEAFTKRNTGERKVKLMVQDTGKGIGQDYLQHKLFKPFAQEDELSPGTGLGLSLVKMITSQLQGQISVQSQIGVGTTITVTLPMEQPPSLPGSPHNIPADDDVFEEQLRELKGLRIQLSGFESQDDGGAGGVDGRAIVEDICSRWLHMDIISDQQAQETSPDIILWSHDALPKSFERSSQLGSTPNVVICANALVAYQQFTSYKSIGQGGVFDFISQPIGPHKFAQCISHAYKSWMGLPKVPSSPRPQENHRYSTSDTGQMPTKASTGTGTKLTSAAIDLAYRNWPSSVDVRDTFLPQTDSLDRPLVQPSIKTFLESGTEPVPSKVLLVDDNYINLKVLSTYMRKLGQEYQTATNGKEAVDAYAQAPEHFIAILMDISMPIMDGLEATRHIRAHEQRKQLPAVAVLALTGLASDRTHREALESGVDVFLTKPIRLKALGEILELRNIIPISTADRN